MSVKTSTSWERTQQCVVMLGLHLPRFSPIYTILVNRGERGGTWGRILVIVRERERGSIVMIGGIGRIFFGVQSFRHDYSDFP